jgi:hypothetical protein
MAPVGAERRKIDFSGWFAQRVSVRMGRAVATTCDSVFFRQENCRGVQNVKILDQLSEI